MRSQLSSYPACQRCCPLTKSASCFFSFLKVKVSERNCLPDAPNRFCTGAESACGGSTVRAVAAESCWKIFERSSSRKHWKIFERWNVRIGGFLLVPHQEHAACLPEQSACYTRKTRTAATPGKRRSLARTRMEMFSSYYTKSASASFVLSYVVSANLH